MIGKYKYWSILLYLIVMNHTMVGCQQKVPIQPREKGKYWVNIKEVSWISTRRAKYVFLFEIIANPKNNKVSPHQGKNIHMGIYIGGGSMDLLKEFSTLERIRSDERVYGYYELHPEKQHYQIIQKSKYDISIISEDGTFHWDNSGNHPPASMIILSD